MKVGVVTTSRADFGIYLPLLQRLEKDPFFDLNLIVSGTHVSSKFGETIKEIKKYDFSIFATSDVIGDKDLKASKINEIYSQVFKEVSEHFSSIVYDWLLVLGDRYEMHAAVTAAIVYGFPIAHIHGGEKTSGAYDEKFRHSITKLSDAHFVSCEVHKKRVLQMGAPDNTVFNTGALSLESQSEVTIYSIEELRERVGVDFSKPIFLVTYNPETVSADNGLSSLYELLKAFEERDEYILVTLGNADSEGDKFVEVLQSWCDRNQTRAKAVPSLGLRGYFSAMTYSELMIGNSSSGIIEAASFNLPVVNIGDRQLGRERSLNVIDVKGGKDKILLGIEKALRLKGRKFQNIYFKENPSLIISKALRDLKISSHLEFVDRDFL